MAEAVLLALTKIGSVLADETAKTMLAKLSEKVNNLRDLEDKIEQIRKQLTAMNNVIRKEGFSVLATRNIGGSFTLVRLTRGLPHSPLIGHIRRRVTW